MYVRSGHNNTHLIMSDFIAKKKSRENDTVVNDTVVCFLIASSIYIYIYMYFQMWVTLIMAATSESANGISTYTLDHQRQRHTTCKKKPEKNVNFRGYVNYWLPKSVKKNRWVGTSAKKLTRRYFTDIEL